MDNDQYLKAAEHVLKAIEACCDVINEATDADIDNIRNGNALTLGFPNGTHIVINLQKPLKEIWLASQSGGYHFKLDGGGVWREEREGLELYSALSKFASKQSGMELVFEA